MTTIVDSTGSRVPVSRYVPRFSAIRRLRAIQDQLRGWDTHNRRRQGMAQLDDHILADLGITREEVASDA